MLLNKLVDKGLIQPPDWLPCNTIYLTMMGSVAYGVKGDTSDVDVYGIVIPPKETIFPHLSGEIFGFGKQIQRFEQYQQHGIIEPDSGNEYDLTIYNIVKFFNLAMQNNPNIIDSLFTPQFCVLHCTKVGHMIRENRKLFLHRGAWHKFRGYSYSQLHKMTSKNPEGKRKAVREKFGFDVKFAYHVVRLLDEIDQILTLGDIDLQRNREHLKAIRRGDVSEAEIRKWASNKEIQLEKAYAESKLPYGPPEDKIKALLCQCLEEHYGKLGDCVVQPHKALVAIKDIQAIVNNF